MTVREETETPLEVLDSPMYTAAIAGRLTNLRPERVRRWLRGYEFSYRVEHDEARRRTKKGPVIERAGDQSFATFLDLIDLLFVKKFLEHGVSLQRLRRALDETRTILGGFHFAQRNFFTDGSKIYLQVQRDADALLELLSGGQWVIAPVIRQLAQQIDFQETSGFAERWYPLGKDGLVVLDPHVSFGAPTIRKRGVETANVFDLYIAERKNTDKVAWWMNLRPEEVSAAVTFEERLAAA